MNKCPSFIILNDKNEVLEYNGSYNHLEKRSDETKSLVKGKIKDRIDNSSDHFNENLKVHLMIFLKKYMEYLLIIIQLNPNYQFIKKKS